MLSRPGGMNNIMQCGLVLAIKIDNVHLNTNNVKVFLYNEACTVVCRAQAPNDCLESSRLLEALSISKF